MAKRNAQQAALRKHDRRAGLPPIPADTSPEQRQFFQAILDNLSVRMGQAGDGKDAAVTFRDLESGGYASGTTVLSAGGGSSSDGDVDTHIADDANPHGVTAAQVGSYTEAEADAEFGTGGNQDTHSGDTLNPHGVTAAQVGSYTQAEADAEFGTGGIQDTHSGDTDNPHSVTAAQVGSYTKAEADAEFATGGTQDTHSGDTSNPHSVTAAQVGADPSGAAATAEANANDYTDTEIAALVTSFDGGGAAAVYTAAQSIDGGGASG